MTSIVWTIYDRICGLSDIFADHFNNLLAVDVQEEAAQEAAHDAHAGEWRKVERGHRTRWVDPYCFDSDMTSFFFPRATGFEPGHLKERREKAKLHSCKSNSKSYHTTKRKWY